MVRNFGEATMERGVMGREWRGSDRPGTTTVSPDSSPEEGRRIAPPPPQAGGQRADLEQGGDRPFRQQRRGTKRPE